MRRNKWLRIVAMAVLAMALLVAQGAWAGDFHFNYVTFTIGSLILRGDLAGLGNQAAEVTLTATGKAQAMCQNNGGNQAPGRNPVFVNTQQTQVFTTDQYGKAAVQVEAPDPDLANVAPSPTPKEAGCPNGNWSVVGFVDGATFWTGARVVVKDQAGVVQIDQSYTCTTFFENGVSTAVSCIPNQN